MKYRKLGAVGPEVSEIGFGAWGIGGGWGKVDDAEAVRAIHTALEHGITFFDTAMGYGDGHSEELLGSALSGRHEGVVVATKVSPRNRKWPALDTDPVDEIFPADWIRECVENSLRRLRRECIDVLQLHCWAESWVSQGSWRTAVEQLKREGKIRQFGVSTNDWDPYNTVSLIESGLVDTVQVIYNLFDQRPAEKLLPAAQRHGVGIIVRVPFEEGLLTGKILPGYAWDPGDWRSGWMTDERLAEARPRVEALSGELDDVIRDLPSLALAFVLSHPAVGVVIPGMRTPAHVAANAAASDTAPLSPEKIRRLERHKWYHGWPYPWDRRGA